MTSHRAVDVHDVTRNPQSVSDLYVRLIESITDYAIFALDATGHVLSWNPGAQRFKGYTASEIIGRHFSVFYPEEAVTAGFPQYELEVATREGRFEDEGWRIRKDGSHFWANVIITALRNDAGALIGFAKVTRDLTERRNAEEQARQLAAEEAAHAEAVRRSEQLAQLNEQEREARTRAERAIHERDALLAIVAHDLRNPIQNIALSVEAILEEPLPPEELVQELEMIASSAEVMERLISTLLDSARIEAGTFAVELVSVDLVSLLDEILVMIEPQARKRAITVARELPTDVPPAAADRARLARVVSNLIANALKFTSVGGSVSVRARRLEGFVQISVEDSGTGILAADLPHVFDRYWRADPTSQTGSGLGLSICKGIVEAHGGRIWVESIVGRGTTFHFTVPCAND